MTVENKIKAIAQRYIDIRNRLDGRILWISKRDGNGIMLAEINNKTYEVYFDKSVFPEFDEAKSNDIVSFNHVVTGGCNCGRDLVLTQCSK